MAIAFNSSSLIIKDKKNPKKKIGPYSSGSGGLDWSNLVRNEKEDLRETYCFKLLSTLNKKWQRQHTNLP